MVNNMNKYLRAIKLAKNYIDNPYITFEGHSYDQEAHEHICFPFRLMGKDFEEICPFCKSKDFEPEYSDYCDYCKYLGVINFFTNDQGDKKISFGMHKPIIEVFEISKGN